LAGIRDRDEPCLRPFLDGVCRLRDFKSEGIGAAVKLDLKRPCANCPFRSDRATFLTKGRAREIAFDMTERQGTFSCHKTNEFGDEQAVETEDSQHCAGALIILEKMERPNQWMRIGERIGIYDPKQLDMTAPVFNNLEEWIRAHGN
jgi:hypothetical protein